MSQTQQTTRASKSYLILLLLAFSQITLSNSYPLSTTYQGSEPCDPSDPSAACGTTASPSPAPRSCHAHQMEWDNLISDEPRYLAVCDLGKATEKHEAGTLELAYLINCYRPQCDSNNNELYTIKQCSFHFSEWCWCSTQHGQAFPETFQKNMPDDFCTKFNQLHCHVDGNDYEIGRTFTPPSVCGLCECHSDGTHTCFFDFTLDANGQLSAEQVETLKSNLLKVFKLQHNDPSVMINVQQIHETDPVVQDEEKSIIVNSRFGVYDSDEDGVLNTFEEFNFHDKLGKLFRCMKFFNHLTEMMDGNRDSEISLEEWNTFFGVVIASEVDLSGDSPTQQSEVQKREAPLDIRKLPYLRKNILIS